jgi:hypothetical protein
VLLVGAFAVRTAAAQEPPATRLEYRVPEGCPAVAEFERRVHLRSARIRFLGAGTAPRTLYVVITASGGASAGTLRLVESDGSDRRRGFQATSCEDAVDGLALIAAVALDPEGASGLAPPPPPAPLPPPPPLPVPRSLGPETPPLVPIKLRLRGGSFGAGGSAVSGLLPRVVGGLYLFGQLDFEYRGWLAPAFRFSGTFPGEHEFDGSGGSALFSMVVPRLEICPIRMGSAQANIRPCVSGSLAIVESVGAKNTLRAGTDVRPVWIPGVSAVGSVRIVGPLGVFGSAGIGFPIPRYEYVFRAHDPSQPNLELYTTYWLMGFAGGGMGLEFP